MKCLPNKRQRFVFILLLSFSSLLFVNFYSQLNVAVLPFRAKKASPRTPEEKYCSQNFRNHDYRSLWNQTINATYSFDPAMLASFSGEKKFWVNFKHMFQEENFRDITCKPRIANASKTPLVHTALASFPGSGNTWTRHLIEQLTGIQTSSVYCDRILSKELKGECMKDKRMAVCTKTHQLPTNVMHTNYTFRKAVLVIRNPFKAVIAFFKFTKSGHTGDINRTLSKRREWSSFSARQTEAWKRFNLAWMNNFSYPIFPLLYGNLQHRDTFFEELFKLSQFFNTNITFGQLWCIWKNREGAFHRKPAKKTTPESTEVYIPDVKITLNAIAEVDRTFLTKFGYHLPFADYI